MAKPKRRARRVQDKVLMHIDAFQGAGKTTLMRQLEKEFPEIIFRDVDDFIAPGYKKANKEIKGQIKGGELTEFPNDNFYDRVNQHTSDIIKGWAAKQKQDVVLVGMAHSPQGAYPDPNIPKDYYKNYEFPIEKRYLYDVPVFKVAWRGTKRWLNVPSLETLLLILRKKQYRDEYKWAYTGAKNVSRHLKDIGYEPRSRTLLRNELQAHIASEALSQDLNTVYTPHLAEPPLMTLMQQSSNPEEIENQALLAARKGTYGNIAGDKTSVTPGRNGMTSTDSGAQ